MESLLFFGQTTTVETKEGSRKSPWQSISKHLAVDGKLLSTLRLHQKGPSLSSEGRLQGLGWGLHKLHGAPNSRATSPENAIIVV